MFLWPSERGGMICACGCGLEFERTQPGGPPKRFATALCRRRASMRVRRGKPECRSQVETRVCACGCGVSFERAGRGWKRKYATDNCRWRHNARMYAKQNPGVWSAKRARWREAGCCTECGMPVKRFKRCTKCRVMTWSRRHRTEAA